MASSSPAPLLRARPAFVLITYYFYNGREAVDHREPGTEHFAKRSAINLISSVPLSHPFLQAKHVCAVESEKWRVPSPFPSPSPHHSSPTQRCDGAKPACQQCIRAKKSDACEYDDGKGKTRTQLMREHITRLEMRIKELENHDHSSPSVTLFDPHAPSPYGSGSSSSSSHGSPGLISLPASASPTPFSHEMDSSWEQQWDGMTDFASTSQVSDPYNPSEEPPFELAQMLLEIFLPHRHQCGLDVHVGRLRDSLNNPLSERRHPVLMNAIYLWACYLSRPGSLSEHEPHYLSRTLAAMSDAIQYPSKVLDVIQASCLLSTYYLSNGRLFEGSYHATVAASLAVQFSLHQIGMDERTPQASADDWDSTFRLEPAKDTIERGERILTFWQVYNLDRCWSVALQRPSTIPDSDHPWTCISTPWPQRMEEYECGDIAIGTGSPTVRGFFILQAQNANMISGYSTVALRAKASALFEAANRLSSSWSTQVPSSNSFMENFRVLEHTISRFASTLLPLHQLAAATPEDKFTLIVIHCLAHASMIRLHFPFMESDTVSRDKCLRAARSLVLVSKHINDVDFDFLDPLVGPCWSSAAKVLESELVRLQTSWPPLNSMEVCGELGALVLAMSRLSTKFPLLAYQAAKVQNSLESK
ncbi:uncharacterized protein FIBRA_06033 [Fibroporia radiculosa]|uniref:Xylanolytic transcriptional activator regulatory domain-containing protein n=1 Tax=Fibroporia radiculosa TaxID=599839 RepID=J4HYH6_9APHY|nr:uncharacterized protein FIBRA_06033 [Fibroporia radiculosa]CCM03882.1 predicted protein [Fibroporia radiculosa]